MTTQVEQKLDALEVMKERHSVRKYEKGVKIPDEDMNEILNATIEAPSSWNLQHWKFLVIEDNEKKEKLLPIAFNQQQVVDSSATIVILGDTEANLHAEEIYGQAVENGFMDNAVKETLVSQINGAYEREGFAYSEAVKNSSLAAMQLMLAAKAKGYDTIPMGGFNPQALIDEFNIPSRYVPVMLISIGKAAAEAHASARFPVERVVIKDSF
ncbi:nitroreductase family protein [Alkalihalobacillus sp. CinArs1]|uniref:nitroreductase family protein n=1 Tax=Alkalihalobacillus sp. CinArs1 TaxID=2995314 RepID=UPI0022DE9387|nr:nitroreductase family protein [Alkalihalobacillus sp. CinArs1]